MSDMANIETRAIGDIVWRKDLYPRFEPDPATIQRYADSIDYLPPIEINQHGELIDGYHRWTAYRKVGLEAVPVTVTPTESDVALLRLAIQRNATHGMQLKPEDKKTLALKLYDGDKDALSKLLSVTVRTITEWVGSIDRARREERRNRIRDMWLACYTQEEIAEEVGVPRQTIAEVLPKMEAFPKSAVLAARYDDDAEWKPPLYNIWTKSALSNTTAHFGNTEVTFVDNLLYLYTEPFDIVVDPFGGGGSTIDICKRRLRRYWVADRLPIPERQDIRQADIADGPPALHKRWQDVSLLYLDPPYWVQAEGQYSKDDEDLANMSLDQFYATLRKFILECAERMRPGAHIALIIQPTQWKSEGRRVIDHVVDLVKMVAGSKLQYEHRISCPYSTEQWNPQQVDWAKANKQLLVLNRELIIWKVVDGS